MSFSAMKRNSGSDLEKLNQELAKMNSGSSNRNASGPARPTRQVMVLLKFASSQHHHRTVKIAHLGYASGLMALRDPVAGTSKTPVLP